MTDKAFRDVAPRYAAWETHEQHLAELRRELAEEREVIGIIARERNEARAEADELREDKACLLLRLTASLERERALRAMRVYDWRGLLALAWWNVREGFR